MKILVERAEIETACFSGKIFVYLFGKEKAHQRKVVLMQDGQVVLWEEALAVWGKGE